jgi:hypothetical protein
MTGEEIRAWLDDELANFPERTSGEELYAYITRRTAGVAETDRASLVEALSGWLKLRSEPRTMLAVDLAAKHRLTELRGEIADLLDDVRDGEAFRPFYDRPILEALERL